MTDDVAPPRSPVERVEGFLRRLERISVDDLSVLALAPADPVEAGGLQERAEDAAEQAGRLDLFDAAVDRSRDVIVQSFSFRGLEPTWFGLNWGRALSRSEDRTRLFEAVEDAAMAAVVEDLLPEEAAALAEPFELAASMLGAAPSSNPSSVPHRNAVRTAWLLGAFGWIAVGANLIVELVAEIVAEQVDPFFR